MHINGERAAENRANKRFPARVSAYIHVYGVRVQCPRKVPYSATRLSENPVASLGKSLVGLRWPEHFPIILWPHYIYKIQDRESNGPGCRHCG